MMVKGGTTKAFFHREWNLVVSYIWYQTAFLVQSGLYGVENYAFRWVRPKLRAGPALNRL